MMSSDDKRKKKKGSERKKERKKEEADKENVIDVGRHGIGSIDGSIDPNWSSWIDSAPIWMAPRGSRPALPSFITEFFFFWPWPSSYRLSTGPLVALCFLLFCFCWPSSRFSSHFHGSSRCRRVMPVRFTEFYRVFPYVTSEIKFDSVLPSLTGFYLVLLGFT